MLVVELNQSNYEYDVHSMVSSFYPEEQVRVLIPECSQAKRQELQQEVRIRVELGEEGALFAADGEEFRWKAPGEDRHVLAREYKEGFKRFLYQTLSRITGKELPWGSLTGIRPTKIAYAMLEQGAGAQEIESFYREKYFVSQEKAGLSIDIAGREQKLLQSLGNQEEGYSLYLGIPFCPTTCMYCSFTSFPLGLYRKKVDTYVDCLVKEMEQAGIWYMPLKGSVLQAVYPRYGMRQMSDNDILYDAAGQKKLACLMQKRGYETEMCGKSNHDVFMKPPVYNYEMHTSLFGKFSGSAFYGYYSGIKEKLLRDKPDGYGYHFTDEDFYIYMTAHTYKHYNQSGVGLRSLADAYVYLNAKGQDMDLAYIARETKKLGMAEFDSQLRALAEKLFCNPSPGGVSLSAQEEATLSFFVGSGAYGTTKFYVQNRMRELQPEGEDSIWKGRLRFIWRRLFPTMEWYENYEPFVAKHKILIPFFLVYRLFRRLFGRGVKGEIDAMRKYGKKK